MAKDDLYSRETSPGDDPSKSRELLAPGTLIDHYLIDYTLKKGGMSTLYLAQDQKTKAAVALKVLLPKFLPYQDIVNRFLNEANILQIANHPQIIELISWGQWKEGWFIAMEYVPGTSLREYLLQTPISLKRALQIIVDIAYAICHLHTLGLIHRDLKPENILISEQGKVKLIDFGIAHNLNQNKTKAPPRRQLIGTPIYISPEQQENPSAVSYTADIYSLGIITYELAIGKLCHGQIYLNLLPKGLGEIVGKALQPKPEERYQDIVDFISEISDYLHASKSEEEKSAKDKVCELSEDLIKTQQKLTLPPPPEWEEVEIKEAHYKKPLYPSYYRHFLSFKEEAKTLLLFPPEKTNATTYLSQAKLEGYLHALSHFNTNSNELIAQLTLLLNERDNFQPLSLFSLTFTHEMLSFFSSFGHLYLISGSPPTVQELNQRISPLTEENCFTIETKTEKWKRGDLLIISSFACDTELFTHTLPAEVLIQKALTKKVLTSSTSEPSTFYLLSIKNCSALQT